MHAFTVWIETLSSSLGYGTIFFLMALESSVFPVPSELVMIPAGFIAAKGQLNVWLAVLAGGAGSLLGACVNYYVLGKFLGRPFIEKYGKYLLIDHVKFVEAENLFLSNANKATFVGRFIPVIRHLISIPAGMFSMPLLPFVALTTLWATIWCGVLAYLWFAFGESVLTIVRAYTHEASIVAVIGLVVGIAWFVLRKKPKTAK